MQPDFIDFIENARNRRGTKFRNQLSVFLVCLLLSVLLWALVRLSKEYIYTVDYKLHYKHIPAGYRLTGYSDSVLTVEMKVQGYDFFTDRLLRNEANSYDVNLRNIKLRNTSTGIRAYMLTNALGYEIISQSNFPHSYLSTTPDTLYFQFERRGLRKNH